MGDGCIKKVISKIIRKITMTIVKKVIIKAINILMLTTITALSLSVDTVDGQSEVQNSDIQNDEPRNFHAESFVLIDGENGRILLEKKSDERRSIASTTKIMTCIIALEKSNPNDIVEVSQRAASMPKVNMRTKVGEKYKMSDLIYAMMLESYNDVAVAIAEHISGTVENFATLMNEKAVQLGAYNTNFVTPNGLDADNHYSTAYDMALIGACAIRDKRFLEIVNKKTYSFNEITGKRSITVNNKNGFLAMESDSIGIKTGFTGKAGYCFVGAVDNNGHRLVSVVLGSGWPPNKSFKWEDTKKLIKYGRKYKCIKVFPQGHTDMNIDINVNNGDLKKVQAKIKNREDYSVLLSEKDEVEIKKSVMSQINAPMEKGECVGCYYLIINGKTEKTFEIVLSEKIEKRDYLFCLKNIYELFTLRNIKRKENNNK